MNKTIKYIFLILFFIINQNLFAQRLKFTTDTAFIRELNDYFPKPDKKDEVNQTLKAFSTNFNTGKLNMKQKEQIILISNQLLKRRAKAIPHFENFLKIILSIEESQSRNAEFPKWLNFFEDFTIREDINASAMNRVFENIIFVNDSSSFYQSPAVLWKHNSTDFKMLYSKNEEPRLQFIKTDLFCYSKRDSSIIRNTTGFYFPVSDRWVGKGGLVNWERSGLNKDSVFATLNNYRINFKFPEFKADSVEFVNKKYFKGKIEGRLEEKVLANATGDKAIYPRFESYNNRVDLKKVVPNIDYTGGFSMYGGKFIGNGDSLERAELFIYKKDELFAKAASKSFVFDKDNVLGDNTEVQIFIDEDSLGHSGLYFNYLIKSKKIALNRSGTGAYRSQFYDTYHKFNIDVSEISFNLDDSVLLFKSPPASTYRKAIFESSSFFSKDYYREIAMIDARHPLEVIKDISTVPGEEFTVYHLAYNLNKAESHCINMLNRLSDLGFVHFDLDKKIAYPLQKLFDYVKANYENKDYDAIKIISEPVSGNNAVLNLKNYILSIYGVKPIPLSENRKVGIVPENSTIEVKKDLEIAFDGKLQAGLARLYGKDMTFYYDSFFVKLESIDSLALFYQSEEKNQDSLYEYSLISSTVDSITGLLRIDEPENKSGEITYPVYPIFESHDKSYVFYDQKSNKDTIYKKEDFYFENFPFEIDSLNTITKNNIRIKGVFKSGGVFPDFEEDLLVQPDSSMGFVHNLGDTGIILYNGLGKYNNTITLNNTGLKGDGKVTYLNTSLYSEQFDFYPDSMNTFANKIEMRKQNQDSLGVKYPQALSDSAYVHWKPSRDQLFVKTLKEPISLFEEKARFTGLLRLEPSELTGKGNLSFIDANLKSDSYTFFNESFIADTADFVLKPNPGEESPFLTYNVNANVNFDNKLGLFKSNGNISYIDFPVNQYKCYMNYFSWQMGINQIDIGYLQSLKNDSINNIALTDSTSVNPVLENASMYQVALTDTAYTPEELAASSKFLSTNPEQDSLSFYASSSSYDVKNFVIKAKGIKFINVADAHIFPSSPLFIERGALIKPIFDARIVASRQSNFHKFLNATVKIHGVKNYSGSGDYEYIDRLDSLQIIHFSEILVDKNLQTIANGSIAEKDSFKLGPEFSYFGKTYIEAEREFIDFDGFTKINHLCDRRMQTFWLQFQSEIDPDSILIPIDNQPKDNQLRKLQAGIYLTNDTSGIYTSFLTTKMRISDVPVLEAKNLLYFNKKTGYYEILDSAKLQNPETDGNYLSFHRKLCLVIAEGKFDLGVKLGQVKLSPAGLIRQNLDSRSTQMEVMLPVDFFFNDAALNEMANAINENYSLEPVDATSKEYQKAFKELVGEKRVKELMQDYSLLGAFSTVPVEMKHSLFFSKVKMKWNNEQMAWKSVGKIGVGNFNGLQVNKLVEGNIEVKKSKSGDILNIYLEINPKSWFFFTYTRGTLKTISSNENYNNLVINLKDKERKSPVKDEDNPYMFFPATEQAKMNFVNEMKKQSEKASEDKDINLDDQVNTEKEEKIVTEESESETEEEEFGVIDENTKDIELEVEDLNDKELKELDNKQNKETEIITDEKLNENNDVKEIKADKEKEDASKKEELDLENANYELNKDKKKEIESDKVKEESSKNEEIELEDVDDSNKEKEKQIENQVKKEKDIENQAKKEKELVTDPVKKTEVKELEKKEEIKETELEEEKIKYEEEEEEEEGGGGD